MIFLFLLGKIITGKKNFNIRYARIDKFQKEKSEIIKQLIFCGIMFYAHFPHKIVKKSIQQIVNIRERRLYKNVTSTRIFFTIENKVHYY